MVNYKWSIFWGRLEPIIGSEQGGTRPILVVSSDAVNTALDIVSVLPLTSFKTGRRIYPTEVLLPLSITGLPKDSIALGHQIRTISVRRLGEKCGFIECVEIRAHVENAILSHLGIQV